MSCRQGADAALLERQADKIQEMASVMRRALELDEHSEHRAQQAIAQLTSENRVRWHHQREQGKAASPARTG